MDELLQVLTSLGIVKMTTRPFHKQTVDSHSAMVEAEQYITVNKVFQNFRLLGRSIEEVIERARKIQQLLDKENLDVIDPC